MSDKRITIGIIGLGYVGLPLAVEFSKKYEVVGFDINVSRVNDLENGIDATLEVKKEELAIQKNIIFTNDINKIKKCNIYIVTVPTPLTKLKTPDLTPLLTATKMIGEILKPNDLVIYESTVYPGCTEEDCVPILEKESKLVYNKDFFCGYSPERINPGDKINTLTKIIKVTSGSTPAIADFVDKLYSSIILAGTHKASSIKVAEASKAIENAQRDLNISFVNELSLIFDRMNIDTIDVINAASTKWNFLPFRPGLVGGHCIGVDPHYLVHKSVSLGYLPQVILSGRRVNDNMGVFIVNKIIRLLIRKGIKIKGCKALILGITFKENCPDIRNSKVIDIIEELNHFEIETEVLDPYANRNEVLEEYNVEVKTDISEISKKQFGLIIHAVSHDFFKEFKLKDYLEDDSVIFDVKSTLPREHVDGRL
jgi:UDP-N-acetyl-D-galactosamine dehydrogenase